MGTRRGRSDRHARTRRRGREISTRASRRSGRERSGEEGQTPAGARGGATPLERKFPETQAPVLACGGLVFRVEVLEGAHIGRRREFRPPPPVQFFLTKSSDTALWIRRFLKEECGNREKTTQSTGAESRMLCLHGL